MLLPSLGLAVPEVAGIGGGKPAVVPDGLGINIDVGEGRPTGPEPTLGLILTADEQNSYRLNIGYCIQGYGFSPYRIGLQSNIGYETAEFNKLTQYLVVGFGYTYYFRDKNN